MAASTSSGPSKQHPIEWLKFLPVAFVCSMISGLYAIYMGFHIPLMLSNSSTYGYGVLQSVAFNLVTLLLAVCYLKCVFVKPGDIPDKEEDPSWEFVPRDPLVAELSSGLGLQESKRSGERRHCKWCGKFKPDRCHHCRVCRACVLKMDHHCPWIYNCVGFRNHKFFFLLLLYSVVDLQLIIWTMMVSVTNSVDSSTPFVRMFCLLFGETLACFLGVLIGAFFCFHVWLMFKAMTTIEFCEKQWKRTGYSTSTYDRGWHGNMKAVLGENFWTWLLPMDPPAGDGLGFLFEETKLTADMEAGRGLRRRPRRQHQLGDSGAPSAAGSSSAQWREAGGGGTGSAPSDQSGPEYEEDSGRETEGSAATAPKER